MLAYWSHQYHRYGWCLFSLCKKMLKSQLQGLGFFKFQHVLKHFVKIFLSLSKFFFKLCIMMLSLGTVQITKRSSRFRTNLIQTHRPWLIQKKKIISPRLLFLSLNTLKGLKLRHLTVHSGDVPGASSPPKFFLWTEGPFNWPFRCALQDSCNEALATEPPVLQTPGEITTSTTSYAAEANKQPHKDSERSENVLEELFDKLFHLNKKLELQEEDIFR